MTSVFELLGEEKGFSLAASSISIGNVYRIEMNEENGVIPKPGDDSRNKYFVVLGYTTEGYLYGGVIMNSSINRNIPPAKKMYHMNIRMNKYEFLHKNSFVDCSSLMRVHIDKFNKWEFSGVMDDDDLDYIIGAVKECPTISKKELQRFNII